MQSWQTCITDPSCPRCKGQPADHIHMFWSCPALSIFWPNIFDAFTKIFGKKVCPSPISAIFGISPLTLPSNAHNVIAFTTLIARRSILLNWKRQSPPSFKRWIRETMYFLKLEKIRFTLKRTTQQFLETWNPFLNYFEELQISLDGRNAEHD